MHNELTETNEALAVANATSRSLLVSPRAADWFHYPGSTWMNPLFISGYQFETPIPMITREGVKPFPPTGYRTLDARSAFFYGISGIAPAARAIRRPPPNRTATAPRRCTSVRGSLTASSGATGSRPCPTRAGS